MCEKKMHFIKLQLNLFFKIKKFQLVAISFITSLTKIVNCSNPISLLLLYSLMIAVFLLYNKNIF